MRAPSRTGSGATGANASALPWGTPAETSSTFTLSIAGPHCVASSLEKPSVVVEASAVKSSVCCAHAMSQCHAGVLSNV